MHAFRSYLRLTVAVAACGVLSACLAGAALARGISTADGGWVWQNPVPTGASYAGVCFVDPMRGWAVGDFGTVLHTVDGGITWYRQAAATSAPLTGVAFADAAHGWAVGSGGTVLRTTNGGDTWEVQDTGRQAEYAAVATGDADHAWIVARDGDDAVVSTDDGGATWDTTDIKAHLGSTTVADIAFADKQQGWIATSDLGAVLHTTNGGKNWKLQDTGATHTSDVGTAKIACADAKKVCVVLDQRSRVTGDGGKTWAAGNSGAVAGAATALADLALSPGAAGWAVSWDGLILRTTDGGLHWTRQGAATPGVVLAGVACGDSRHAWIVGAGGAIRATSDGGATWKKQDQGELDASVVGSISSIDFVDAEHGWSASDTILHTADGGDTWTPAADDAVPQGDWLNGLDFSDEQKGCAVSQGGRIFRSTDGGATWDLAYVPGGTGALRAVAFASDHGWAVGDQGTVLHTTNGGASWTAQHTDSASLFFMDVDFIDAQTGWIVGACPQTVLQTTDGGATWTALDLGAGDVAPVAVDFVDKDDGWVACGGPAGVEYPLFHTTDGGQTWTPIYLGLDYGMTDVAFADTLHGWAVGQRGTIVATVDGGETWTVQPSGTGNGLSALSVVDQSNAWVAGDLFTLLHTADGGLPVLDALAPTTVITGTTGDVWQNKPVTFILEASDGAPAARTKPSADPAAGASSGVQLSEWALDPQGSDPSQYGWRAAAAAFTVSAEGSHGVAVRSIDYAGNVESPHVVTVRIDTRRPTPVATKAASVARGKKATLRFSVRDPRPGAPTCDVTIAVKNAAGTTVATFALPGYKVNAALSCAFPCTLKKGTYRFLISACDAAGNRQTKVASNTLTVK
jgi:photosystem II stability/assembly factor-like uncharacterized protein